MPLVEPGREHDDLQELDLHQLDLQEGMPATTPFDQPAAMPKTTQ